MAQDGTARPEGARAVTAGDGDGATLRDRLGLGADVGLGWLQGRTIPAAAGIVVPRSLAGAAAGRRSSFARGRYGAQRAIAALGIAASGTLAIDEAGLPVWPPGITGSISHGDDAAVAVAARQSRYAALGIDLEPLTSAADAAGIASSIAAAEELDALPDAYAPLIAFCAKEALYKALRPGRFLDFDAARLRATAPGSVELVLTRRWRDGQEAGQAVRARWTTIADHLVIAIAVPSAA